MTADPYIVVAHEALTPAQYAAVLDLCSRAYDEEFSTYLASLRGATHLLLYEGGNLASHACWVDRWLQQAAHPPLRTAYVEAVATDAAARRKGHARTLMGAIAALVQTYPFAALSPAETRLYARLGWLSWRGPLFVRTATGTVPAPDEQILYLPTPLMPPWIDPDAPLSCEWRDAPEQW